MGARLVSLDLRENLLLAIIVAAMSVIGWGLLDRLTFGAQAAARDQRITTLEQHYTEIERRLDRQDSKLDRLIERLIPAP